MIIPINDLRSKTTDSARLNEPQTLEDLRKTIRTLCGDSNCQAEEVVQDIDALCAKVPTNKVASVIQAICQVVVLAKHDGFDASEIIQVIRSGVIPLMGALVFRAESLDRVSELVPDIFRRAGRNFAHLLEALINATSGEITIDYLEGVEIFLALTEDCNRFIPGFGCEVLISILRDMERPEDFIFPTVLDSLCIVAGASHAIVANFGTQLRTVIERPRRLDTSELIVVLGKMKESATTLREAGLTKLELGLVLEYGTNILTTGLADKSLDEKLIAYDKLVELVISAKRAGVFNVNFMLSFGDGIITVTRLLARRTSDDLSGAYDKLYEKLFEMAKLNSALPIDKNELWEAIARITQALANKRMDEILSAYDKVFEVIEAAEQAQFTHSETKHLLEHGLVKVTEALATFSFDQIGAAYDKLCQIAVEAKQRKIPVTLLFASIVGPVIQAFPSPTPDELIVGYDKVREIAVAVKQMGMTNFECFFEWLNGLLAGARASYRLDEFLELGDQVLRILDALKQHGIVDRELNSIFSSGIRPVTEALGHRISHNLLEAYGTVLQVAVAAKQAGITKHEFESLFNLGIRTITEVLAARDLDAAFRAYKKVLEIAAALKHAGVTDEEFYYSFRFAIHPVIKALADKDLDIIFKACDKVLEIVVALKEAGFFGWDYGQFFQNGIVRVTQVFADRDLDEIFALYDKLLEIKLAAKKLGIPGVPFFIVDILGAKEVFGGWDLNDLVRAYDKRLAIGVAAYRAGLNEQEIRALFSLGINTLMETFVGRDPDKIFNVCEKVLEIAVSAIESGIRELQFCRVFGILRKLTRNTFADSDPEDILRAFDKVLEVVVSAKQAGMNSYEFWSFLSAIKKLTQRLSDGTSLGTVWITNLVESVWSVAQTLRAKGVKKNRLGKLLSSLPDFISLALNESDGNAVKLQDALQRFIDAALNPLPSDYKLPHEGIGELETFLLFVRTGAVYSQFANFTRFKEMLEKYRDYRAEPLFECNEEFEFLINVEGGEIVLKPGAVIDSGRLKHLNEAINSRNRERLNSHYQTLFETLKKKPKLKKLTVSRGQLNAEILKELAEELRARGGKKRTGKTVSVDREKPHSDQLTPEQLMAIRFLVRQVYQSLEDIPELRRDLYNKRGRKDVAEIHGFLERLIGVLSHTKEQVEQVHVKSRGVKAFVQQVLEGLTVLIDEAESMKKSFECRGKKEVVQCLLDARKDWIDAVGYGDLGDCCIVSHYGNEIEREDFQPIRIVDWEGRIVGYVYALKAEVEERKIVDGEVIAKKKTVMVLAGVEPNWGIRDVLDPESFVSGLVGALTRVCQENGITALYSNAGDEDRKDDGRISELSEVRAAIRKLGCDRVERLTEQIQFPANFGAPIAYVYKFWETDYL